MNPQRSLMRSNDRLRLAGWGLALLVLLAWAILVPAGTPFAEEFMANTIGDFGRVTVMEVSGNYDANNPDGTINAAAREAVSREFYRTHKDEYDFLILVTNFDMKMPESEAKAFYMGVKNDTRGIGEELFDNTSFFGSAGRLQGTIDMGNLSAIVTDPLDPAFENTFYIMNHELMHRWGARVKFRDADGAASSALLGKDGSHWSFLLDSQGSVLYGNSWKDNGDGTFTAQQGRKVFSPLDLYLMGIYDKSKVPPLMLLESPAADPAQAPKPGVTITGTARYVTIDDIIALEGERNPPASQSQKKFNAAVVFLTTPETFTGYETEALENLLKGWLTRYSILTDAAALMSATPAPIAEVATNPGFGSDGGSTRTTPASSEDGVSWLLSTQKEDGSWSGTSRTTDKDTAAVTGALTNSASGSAAASRALEWLAGNGEGNSDFLAAKVAALAGAGRGTSVQVAALLARQNADGGWGSDTNYSSNPLDTALVLNGLTAARLSDPALNRGAEYLLAHQNGDGGWGYQSEAASTVLATAEVSAALQKLPVTSSLTSGVRRATTFLLNHQNADGGFGSSPSTVYETAQAYRALSGAITDMTVLGAANGYLSAKQQQNGSWQQDPLITAVAVHALELAAKLSSPPPPPTTGTVSGSVVDTTTGQPLAGAMVTVASDPSLAATTSAAGAFNIPNVPQGAQTIAVSLAAYTATSAPATVSAGSVVDLGAIAISPSPTTGVIKGTVTSASGAPLSGASIIVTGSSQATASSAADGSFSIGNIAAGNVTVTASKDGYDPRSTAGTVSAGEVLFFSPQLPAHSPLPSSGSLTGKVVDSSNNRPLADVSVTLQGNPAIATTTDAAGVFTLGAIPQGSQSLTFAAAGYAPATVTATVSASFVVNVGTVTLSGNENQTGIRGSVTDAATGELLAGATVSFTGVFSGTTVTGADGSFAVSGVAPGAVTVTASKSGYYPVSASGSVSAGAVLYLTPRLSPIPAPPQSGTVTGRVVDAATNQPLVGVSLALRSDSSVRGASDGTGSFTLTNVPAGPQKIDLTLSGYAAATVTVEVTAGALINLGSLPVSANPTTGMLKGTITEAAGGQPLSGVTVAVSGSFTGSVVTSADGSFAFNAVSPGEVTIAASKAGYTAVTATATIAAGGVQLFNPQLAVVPPQPTTATVTGKVVDAATGEPLSGVSAILVQPGKGAAAVSDATGSFVLSDVPPGSQEITFSLSGHATATAKLNLSAGFIFDLGTIPLASNPATGALKGKVTDAADGKPVAGAAITLSGAYSGSVLSAADGSYTFPEVAPGDVTVTVSKAGYGTAAGTLGMVAGAIVSLDLQLAVIPPEPTTGGVLGTVVEAATGKPLAGVTVTARGTAPSTAVTDATGAFSLANLAAGSQTLDFTFPGYLAVSARVETVAGVTLNLGTIPLSANPTTGLIKGTATDAATGAPLAGATVTVTGSFSATAVTAADGSFLFSEVTPGEVTLIAARSGYYSVAATGSVAPGGVVAAELQLKEVPPLPPTGVLTGRVLDSVTLAPVEGAMIFLSGLNSVTSDVQGNFTTGSLSPGTYQVTISAAGHVGQIIQLMVVAGSSEIQTVYLAPLFQSTTVSGKVTDASTGLPLAGAEIALSGAGRFVRTDSSGSYTLTGISLSEFSLRASASGYDSKSITVRSTAYLMRSIDFALTASKTSDTVAIGPFSAERTAYLPNQTVALSAVIANSGSGPAEVTVIARIADPQGNVVDVVAPAGAASVSVAPSGSKEVALQWNTGQTPPGSYSVSLIVADAASGVLLGQKEISFAVEPGFTLTNLALNVSPTFTYSEKLQTVKLSSLLSSSANIAADLVLGYTFTDAQGNTVRQGSSTITLSAAQQTVYREVDEIAAQFAAGAYTVRLAASRDGAVLKEVSVPFTVLSNLRIDTQRSVAPAAVAPDAEGRVRIIIELKGEAK